MSCITTTTGDKLTHGPVFVKTFGSVGAIEDLDAEFEVCLEVELHVYPKQQKWLIPLRMRHFSLALLDVVGV